MPNDARMLPLSLTLSRQGRGNVEENLSLTLSREEARQRPEAAEQFNQVMLSSPSLAQSKRR